MCKWPRRNARLSLFTRVFLVNAAVLAIVTLLLLFSPIEISYPVTTNQAVILVSGFLVSLGLTILLLRGVVAPLTASRRQCTRWSRSIRVAGS